MEKLNLQGHKAGNLSFREIYDSMDRRAFVRRIATVTGRIGTNSNCTRTWHPCQRVIPKGG